MAEKRESYQSVGPGVAYGVPGLPTQESIDLLTRLLQEFERRSTPSGPSGTTLPPEVARDIAAVGAAFESLESALAFGPSPIDVSSVTPSRGPASGGTRVTITGSHLLPGSTVLFGNVAATHVSVVSLTEIQATTPPGSAGYAGHVDVVVNTLAGSAILARGFTYHAA
jgi:IPT/TIG domain